MIPTCPPATRQKAQRNFIFRGITWLVPHVVSTVRKILREREQRRPACDAHEERLFSLVRELLDLSFTYAENPVKFHEKFREAVNVKSLVKRGIINPNDVVKNYKSGQIRRGDAEFLAVLERGFTYREVAAIYNYKGADSVYSRHHRVRKRMAKLTGLTLDEQQHGHPRPDALAEK